MLKKDICVEYIAHRCNKLAFLKMIPVQWSPLRACEQFLHVSRGSNCSKRENIVQYIFTEIQKILHNLLYKYPGKKTLLLVSGSFLYSQNNPQKHFRLYPMAGESGNIDGSHVILTAGPHWSHFSGNSVQLFLVIIDRLPKMTFAVRFVLHIVSSPL